MRVIRAEFMGLCFGVRDALAVAKKTEDPASVTIYGELVHNLSIQNDLISQGFQIVGEAERDSSQLTDRLMITAHGVSQKRLDILRTNATEIIDTTCPLVRRVHEASQTLERENRLVIVIGRRNHVEVQGIVEDLNRCVVIETPDQVTDWNADSLGIVSQSTTTPDLAQRCLAAILSKNSHADIRYIDTICRPTRQRQQALESLCQSVSTVVVVGGKHSNNTRQLAQRCTELGCTAIQVESVQDLRPETFHGLETVGLTAGTSTPDSTIDEVEKFLTAISNQLHAVPNTPTVERMSSTVPRTSDEENFSQQWLQYFNANQSLEAEIPWSERPTLSSKERKTVARSIQTFQLGETGSGRHFLKQAERWGLSNDDPVYRSTAARFIDEEHRHAEWLGQFLAQEGIPKLQQQWTDSVFRRLRRLAGLRTCIAVLVSAEIMAQVYYHALQLATRSDTLKALCKNILREEAFHVRFQILQLARIDRNRSPSVRRGLRMVDRLVFGIAKRVVYHDHRSVFHLAGISRTEFNRLCKKRWVATERIYIS